MVCFETFLRSCSASGGRKSPRDCIPSAKRHCEPTSIQRASYLLRDPFSNTALRGTQVSHDRSENYQFLNTELPKVRKCLKRVEIYPTQTPTQERIVSLSLKSLKMAPAVLPSSTLSIVLLARLSLHFPHLAHPRP